MVKSNAGISSFGRSDAMCTACEMSVVWMQNQLKENKTLEVILNYVNQVNKYLILYLSFFLFKKQAVVG